MASPRMFATQALAVHNEGSVDLVVYDEDWQPVFRNTLVGADRAFTGFQHHNVSMMMSATIPAAGSFAAPGQVAPWLSREVLVYKQVDTTTRPPNNPLDDFGDLFLHVRPYGMTGRETPAPPEAYGAVHHVGFGNQPHVTFWDDHVLVAYTEAVLEVDEDGEVVGISETQNRIAIYPVRLY